MRREALEYHPELRIRIPRAAPDTFDESVEELTLMNVSEGNVIPTFLTVAAGETEPLEPKTVHQEKNDTSWPEWEGTMLEEVNSLKQNKTWQLTDPPRDRQVLSGKWVFKLKRGPHGEVIRHKSRWVVRGFAQEEGIDYDESFASVVKPMSYKALFEIAAAQGLDIEQMDVKTAFLEFQRNGFTNLQHLYLLRPSYQSILHYLGGSPFMSRRCSYSTEHRVLESPISLSTKLAISSCPPARAITSAVCPIPFSIRGSAPCSNKKRTASTLPIQAAA